MLGPIVLVRGEGGGGLIHSVPFLPQLFILPVVHSSPSKRMYGRTLGENPLPLWGIQSTITKALLLCSSPFNPTVVSHRSYHHPGQRDTSLHLLAMHSKL